MPQPNSTAPYWNGKAFLGYYHKAPDLAYEFDGQVLCCRLRPSYYRQTALMAVFLGPVMMLGLASLAVFGDPRPWYFWLVMFAVSGLGWLQIVEAIRTRVRMECDFAARRLSLFNRRQGAPLEAISFGRVEEVATDSFYRPRNTRMLAGERVRSPEQVPGAVYRCHEISLLLDDGAVLTLCESTDEQTILGIAQVLRRILED